LVFSIVTTNMLMLGLRQGYYLIQPG
jgi:hypothetical protein